jgi:hypothetical protein
MVSRFEGAPPTSTGLVAGETSPDLKEFWRLLPEQDKTEFEGHFSRMVLRLFQGLSSKGGQS